jgi:hypothetical protein
VIRVRCGRYLLESALENIATQIVTLKGEALGLKRDQGGNTVQALPRLKSCRSRSSKRGI